ncbi:MULTISPECIES: hypothetical protein [unclassified Bradyrhizobium]|uniref:hypothetical protein n=1 Tax=unclassified Bradyrhizobium TaxID=2631580 RepID=UPI00247A050E|nr:MULTISPECIES: hypothetical protein [unclassified Bradyrhizobium]WGR74347.1 hypothetical protein MTX24_16615 [Bradyrhizobium sp. ISRA426]WGR79182.1 hypothetical protein MTX21_01730 [Bradyrhizobium sp. ISRA430]WGR90603.1 hypothetical protein MTX25_39540 [Bradyrhizobium sp. ISRA432]
MTALDVANDASFGLRTEQGVAPQNPPSPEDGGEALFRAAFRQTNSFVSAMQYMRNSGSYQPVPGYNPLDEIKGWGDPRYFLEHGHSFVGSQSQAETQAIKSQIDTEEGDRRLLSSNGKIGFIASTMAGMLDPTMLLPGGVGIDAARGGLTFTKAVTDMGKAGLMATASQEAIMQATQQTRPLSESALNVASGTLLTALLGGGAASLLAPEERAVLERALSVDRAEMNAHAGNPPVEMPVGQMGGDSAPETGTGFAVAAGAAASDTRKLELVDFGLNQIPGVRRVVEKTSPMQRVFGSDSVSARRAGADLAETSLLFKENVEEGKSTVFGGGPALDREAGLKIKQGQVAVGDELDRLFTEYRYGDQLPSAITRTFRKGIENLTGAPEGKLSFDQFKEAVSDAMRNGDQHDIPQVTAAAQQIRKVFDTWKERAIKIGLLPEDVDVKTADSYVQRLYNKQAIAAQRPEFVNRVTDWLAGQQQAKADAQGKIGAYHGAMQVAVDQIEKLQGRIAKLETDADVIAARQEETTRINKAANQRSRKLREGADQENLPLQNARGGAVFETLARNRGNLLADRASAKLAEIEGLEQKLASEVANRDAMRAKIEEEIGRWEGKSTAEAKAALKARAEAEKARQAKIEAGESKSTGERLSSADKAVDRAVKRILESDRDMPRDELRARAQEITDRILGSPDGRLPYDLGMEHGTGGFSGGEPPRGALAAREFNIPDATIRDFLENDIEHIVAAHLRTMVPDVLLTEKFGDVRMTEAFRKINDEYAALVDGAKSEKERTRIEKERQGVIDDLSAIRDRIRGVYGISPDLPMRNVARAANVLKQYNVLTSMGSAALSSLPDMAGTVLRHGLTTTFRDAWGPFFNMMTRQSDVWKEAGRQYRAMGIAVESVLASRHHAITDVLDTYHPQSRVERTMQWATGKFQFANMLAPWTDFAKINASLVAGSEILRAVKASAEGTASARQIRNLGESGIEPHMAARIAKAFEDGGEIRDGVHLPNTADWTDKEARRVFEGAVARDADISVVTPGQEKPLWMSHPILSVIGQFKSFTAAATERVLISNLQRRDAQVLQGMIFSMGLGMLSYKLSSLTGGQPTSDKPQDWIKEAISKGNLLGWFEEGNALASKATRGGVDIYRLIGADKPTSRYVSRSALDQLLGPTAGKIGGILSATSAVSKPSEWNEGDTKAIRRLIAGQNLFWLRGALNQVEAGANNAFGIPMKIKPEGH